MLGEEVLRKAAMIPKLTEFYLTEMLYLRLPGRK